MAAKIAVKMAMSEDGRKKLIILLLAPLIAGLLLCCLVTYLLASPIRTLWGTITGGPERDIVNALKADYGSVVQLQKGSILLAGRYPAPAAGEVVSSFGMRIHPITGEWKQHNGIDIGTAWHTPVQAIATGSAITIGSKADAGIYVKILHELPEETFTSVYCHLSEVLVIEGQDVIPGDIIGLEGGEPGIDPNPGSSTGHHLHFEIHNSYGEPVDPVPYLYEPVQTSP